MSKYETLIHDFLYQLVKLIDSDSGRFTKAEIESYLEDFIQTHNLDMDAGLLFDEWESLLRKTRVVSVHAVYYSIAREALEIEKIPSVEQMQYFAELHTDSVEQILVERIEELGPIELEELVEHVFRNVPWTEGVSRTPTSRDGGLDIIGSYADRESGLKLKLLGEVKHWKRPIGAGEARDFLGMLISVGKGEPCCGIYVSTGGFSTDANRLFKNSHIQIMTYDINEFVRLMIKENIGVNKFKVEGLVVDEQLWRDLDLQ